MPRFSADLSHLFREHPFPARFAAAASAGFAGVEFPFPQGLPAGEVGDLVGGLAPVLIEADAGTLDAALALADLLECRRLLLPATDTGALRRAAQTARDWEVGLMIACGPQPEATVALLDEVGERNLQLLYDIHDAQTGRGGLTDFIETNIRRIGHIRIAGIPGRHEPDIGEVNYPYLFDLLDAHGYDGWIGCSYTPRADTLIGLRWGRAWGLG